MAEAKPTPTPRPTATSSGTSTAPTSAAVRNRLLPHPSSSSPSRTPPAQPRRRSSLLSLTSLERSSSQQSWADELLNPKTGRSSHDDNQVTHWHSSPIAFAILPAVGGLLFTNGSAVVTDGLLLILAALFMNWSIRLPWDWYYSAQAVRENIDEAEEADQDDSIPEEDEDEVAVETSSSNAGSPDQSTNDIKTSSSSPTPNAQNDTKRSAARASLQRQELSALLATFLFPALAAYLLHLIRAQLSRPATGLVSDANLFIFLLAAAVRPCRQLVRLLSNRTLHLQRSVHYIDGESLAFGLGGAPQKSGGSLGARIADLEARLNSSHTHSLAPETLSLTQKADISSLSDELRKRYEPRLEGLERAVRRYEKRSTTQTMLTEQRLLGLEKRLQDALSLAAVAAKQSQRPGVLARALETTANGFVWPLKVAWGVCVWPLSVVEEVWERARGMMLGPYPVGGGLGGADGKKKGGGVDEKGRRRGLR